MDIRYEELLRNARKADKIDRERAELFGPLVASAAWKCYVEVLNAKLQSMSEQLLAPAAGVDGAVFGEYLKGAMFGIMLSRDLPGATIESMKGEASGAEESDDG